MTYAARADALGNEARASAMQRAVPMRPGGLWLACGVAVVGVALAAAVRAGLAEARHSGQLDGICIALDMVMAHGLMDDAKRDMVTEALASPSNPYFDRIDLKRSQITRRCRRIADERWRWN